MQTVRLGSETGWGCLFLFGLPFGLAGLGVLFLVSWSFYDWNRMQSWEESPATILDVRMAHSEDTERVEAKYEYQFQNRQYRGDRVGIHWGSDNIGSFHRDAFVELKEHQERRLAFPCFVNPKSPSEAVLYRHLRWKLVALLMSLGLVFSSVGGAITTGALVARRRFRGRAQRKAQFPDEPWMWRADWAEGMVHNQSYFAMIVASAIAVFWNLISWPIALILIPQELARGDGWVKLMFVFPFIGLGMIANAGYLTFKWWKFRGTKFQLAVNPGLVGGSLSGVVHAPNVSPQGGFRQSLQCIESTDNHEGQKAEEVIWQSDRLVDKEISSGNDGVSLIPVLFHIPYECQPSSAEDESIQWRLEVAANSPGINYKSKFDVPVFKTSDSSRNYRPDESLIAEYTKPESDAVYERCRIVREHLPGGYRFHLKRRRGWGVFFGLAVFLTIWCGFLWMMLNLGAPIMFPIVFGAAALLIGYFALDLLLWHADFQVSPTEIRGRFGWLGWERSFPLSEIGGLTVEPGMRSGATSYYSIALHTHNAKPYVICKRIAGLADAKSIAADLRNLLGLEPHSEFGE